MNFVCIVFELGDKMLTLSSMENLIVQCNQKLCQQTYLPSCGWGGCKHRVWGRSSILTCQAMGGVGVNTGSWEEALPANLPAKLWVGWV